MKKLSLASRGHGPWQRRRYGRGVARLERARIEQEKRAYLDELEESCYRNEVDYVGHLHQKLIYVRDMFEAC